MSGDGSALLMLLISVGALALGPMFSGVMRRARGSTSLFTGFVLVSVLGLVLMHIIPHAVHAIGAWAIPPIVLGLFAPVLLERQASLGAGRAHTATLLLVCAGLFVHGLIDGMALSGGRLFLAASLAVIVHRLPASLLIWSIAAPRYGARLAWAVLGSLGVATVIGFIIGQYALLSASPTALGVFHALLGGLLLHVISDHLPAAGGARGRWDVTWETIGGVLALGLLLFVSHSDGHHGHSAYGARLLDLALESAPALLLGYALAGVVAELLPGASLAWLRRGGGLSQAARGVAFGLPVPICSCGVVPLYQSLVRRGAPPAAAMAFLIATPELGLESVALSVPLLGWNLAIVRVLAAALVAVAVGWWVGRALKPAPEVAEAPSSTRRGMLARALRYGFVEVVDMTGSWILVGLLVAALMTPEQLGWLAAVPSWIQVPLFALVGLPLYVCASGATPLAAGLIFAGVSPGAALAFLLAGPATNVTTFGVLRGLHGRGIALRFALGVMGVAVLLGWAVNLLAGGWSLPQPGAGSHELPSLLQQLSLAALGVAVVASLLRQGPHGWLASLRASGGHHHGSHGCASSAAHHHEHGACHCGEPGSEGQDHARHGHDHGAHAHACRCHEHGGEGQDHGCAGRCHGHEDEACCASTEPHDHAESDREVKVGDAGCCPEG